LTQKKEDGQGKNVGSSAEKEKTERKKNKASRENDAQARGEILEKHASFSAKQKSVPGPERR